MTMPLATTGQFGTGSSSSFGAPRAIVATILYHPDLARVGETTVLIDQGSTQCSAIGRESPVFRTPDGKATSPLHVGQVSESAPLHVTGLQHGGARLWLDKPRMEVAVNGVPVVDSLEVEAAAFERGCVVVLGRAVALLLHAIEVALQPVPDYGLVGASRALREVRAEIKRVADRDVPVLLRGETGVGKELVASAIHAHSTRANGPYVPVNMSAIPTEMAESELFGYVRGAFTGAQQARAGHFAQAHCGTLFLDEIGTASADVQAKLLRIIEHGELLPLGGKATRVDVRLIAATDSNLESAMDDGSFRRPLLERLSGYTIHIAPLRERRDDIPRLFLYFLRGELEKQGELPKLQQKGRDGRPWLPLRFMLGLLAHDWPGNVRELFNAARQVAIGNRDDATFRVPDELNRRIPQLTRQRQTPPPQTSGRTTGENEALPLPRKSKPARQLSDAEIKAALERNQFNLNRTATELEISRTTLDARIRAGNLVRKASDLNKAEIEEALAACGGDLAGAAARLSVSERGLLLRIRALRIGPKK